jgi:alanine racemase
MTYIRKLLGLSEYQALNVIEISKQNLLYNLKVLSKVNAKVKVAPVLKSNAYGHGLTLVARMLDSHFHGNDILPFFCVDSLYEAYELLKANIKTPILIMGYIEPSNLRVKRLPFSYTISTMDVAEAISKYQPQAGVHIFVDTGMHREGILLSELPTFLEKLPKNLKVEGLMSHLASGELPDDPQTKQQIKNFQKDQEIVKKAGFNPKWIHLQNSGGLLALHTRCGNVNMARVGLALYGINHLPSLRATTKQSSSVPGKIASGQDPQSDDLLKPILTLKSKLIQIKTIGKGERVGYNGTLTTKIPTAVGILPLGYYDGLDRRLSNKRSLRDESLKGVVIINSVECPIIGRVSMNITAIDISKVKNPQIGQEVIIYSNNPLDKNSLENAAKICQTIPYDLLVHLNSSTRRILI